MFFSYAQTMQIRGLVTFLLRWMMSQVCLGWNLHFSRNSLESAMGIKELESLISCMCVFEKLERRGKKERVVEDSEEVE